jgi:selenide,water dikinase
MTDLLFDPQTSGGLLIAMAEDKAATFVSELKEKFHIQAHIVGRVIAREDVDIKVV